MFMQNHICKTSLILFDSLFLNKTDQSVKPWDESEVENFQMPQGNLWSFPRKMTPFVLVKSIRFMKIFSCPVAGQILHPRKTNQTDFRTLLAESPYCHFSLSFGRIS